MNTLTKYKYDVLDKGLKVISRVKTHRSNKGKLPITLVNVLKGHNPKDIHVTGLICLWDSGAYHSVIRREFVRKFKRKFIYNLMEAK